MDKLKLYLAVLRKHYFWVLCGLILIVSLTTWSMATRDLEARYKDNHGKINSTFMQLNDFHAGSPNDKFKVGLEGERTKLNGQVAAAWEEFSSRQRKLLEWPAGVEAVNQLKNNEEIPEPLRVNFVANVVKPHLEQIFEKVDIRRPKGAVNPDAGLLGERAGPVEFMGIVTWDASKREELRNRFKMNEIPSTTWVRTKMEDMWIYESIVNIISEINKGSTDSLNANIKRIERLNLAQWAIQDAQKNPGTEVVMKKDEASLSAPSSGTGEDTFVHIPGVGEQKLEPDLALLDGRYIDENNLPVPAEAVIGSIVDPQSEEGKLDLRLLEKHQRQPKNPPFAEFRQVFVDLQFMMDQRKIPDLMAACANSPLPIEIRQVLMHFYDIDMMKSVGGVPGAGDPLLAEQAIPGRSERAPYDALVQIRGIVYIYNQPSATELGQGSAAKPAQRKLGIPLPKKAEEMPLTPMESQF